MNEQFYEFDCGCRFRQYGTHIKENDGLPSISIDYYNLPDCPKAWYLLGTGKTKGVFQLETNLGQTYSQKLEPWNLEELAALTALLRPACLESIVDGKNLTEHYCDRKNKREDVQSLHSALDDILDETYQIITYQEQAIKIAQQIAGFSLIEGEELRKAAGKKDAELMGSIKDKFIKGCIKTSGLSEKDATEIFNIIEKSQRYSFNASHSVSYGMISYWTAYVKAHFPLQFYTSWLYWAKDKMKPQDEIRDLISDMKLSEYNIFPPSLDNLFLGDPGEFCLNKGNVYFGLSSVKGIGKSHIQKLIADIRDKERVVGKKIKDWSWKEFLCNLGNSINKTVMNNLILIGATPGNLSRKRSLFEYKFWEKLTDIESAWLIKNQHLYKDLKEGLKKLSTVERKNGGPTTDSRRKIIAGMIENLENPKYDLKDDPEWIALNEQNLLSVSLSSHILDSVDAVGDFTIKEFLDGGSDKGVLICRIQSKKDHIIKNGKAAGQRMCFLSLEDQSGKIDAVCFSNVYSKYKDAIFEGNIVAVKGKRSDKSKDGLIVNSLENI